MKKHLLVPLVALMLLAAVWTQGQRSRATWQSSESASVQLGVRDKYGELGNYEATFVVTTPLRETFRKTIQVRRGEFGYVSFPDGFDLPSDYQTRQRVGRFKWVCIVRGLTVLRGEFQIATSFDLSGL